jgi:hypothetical protein
MVAAEYLHTARRDPAAEYLHYRRHASSSSSGFDPAAGDTEPRRCPLILAVVQMRGSGAGNLSPELEVAAAALGLRVRGWPPTRTLAQYKYGAAGWNCRAPYSADMGRPEYGAC